MACAGQQTPEWFKSRIGCLTASKAKAVLCGLTKDGKPYKATQDLIDDLIAERITGLAVDSYINEAMIWGTEKEDEARARYEIESGNLVEEVGFVKHPTLAWFGASPDGLVGKDGLLEIKCPKTTTHLRRLKDRKVPAEYKPQMLVQLICTGRRWVDFVDYDPRVPDKLQYFSVRYEPSPEEIKDAEEKCIAFLNEVDRQMAELLKEE